MPNIPTVCQNSSCVSTIILRQKHLFPAKGQGDTPLASVEDLPPWTEALSFPLSHIRHILSIIRHILSIIGHNCPLSFLRLVTKQYNRPSSKNGSRAAEACFVTRIHFLCGVRVASRVEQHQQRLYVSLIRFFAWSNTSPNWGMNLHLCTSLYVFCQ